MRPWLITVLGGFLAVSLACSEGKVAVGPDQVVLRFIDDDPEVELPGASAGGSPLVVDWTWPEPTDPERWRATDVQLRIRKRGGLLGVIDGAHPSLQARVRLDAHQVEAIEIDALRIGKRPLHLAWLTSDDAEWSPDNRIPPSRLSSRDGALTYQFQFAGHPGWTGEVTAIRLELPTEDLGRFTILAVRGIATDGLGETLARAWKVDLGNDMRNALLAPPGVTHDRTLRVPAGARLNIAFGAPSSFPSPVSFQVTAVDADDRTYTLVDIDLPPTPVGRWQQETIDLARFTDREITIRLSTSSPEPWDATHGFPAWANPVVVAPTREEPPPNIIMICLDTLRADGLSSYGNPLPTSPNIDAWAQDQGVRFKNAVAAAPWTLPSHVSMFTGMDAVRHGINFASGAPPGQKMLAERLRDHGYTTGAVTGGGYLGSSFGFIQGFDTFDYWPEKKSVHELKWVTDTTLEWIDANSRLPFFLFVHTYETHYPHRRRQPFFNQFAQDEHFEPAAGNIQMRNRGWRDLIAQGDAFVIRRPGSPDWSEQLTPDEIETVRLMYLSAVAYADTKVQAILDHLATHGVAERTMVILTSDHGEALGEGGRAGHTYLDDFNLMVPLIIEFPGRAHAGATIDHQVRSVDLVPTILETAGLPIPEGLDGRSLLPLITGGSSTHPTEAWAYAGSSNRGLALRIDNTTKYIFPDTAWFELASHEALYDLETDPTESTDLVDNDPRSDEFRTKTRETILEQHSGYRLEMANQGPTRIEGQLTGQWVKHDRVKIADHGCGCVHWMPGKHASFDLVPGDRAEILFVDTHEFDVGIKGSQSLTDERPTIEFGFTFNLDAITLPVSIEPDNGAWRIIEGAESPPATGFYLTLSGDRVPSDRGAAPDEATIEQLRALGYIQ